MAFYVRGLTRGSPTDVDPKYAQSQRPGWRRLMVFKDGSI
jgi:hypothetical protein